MLKLKPSPRELVMLLVLAMLVLGVAWYMLFFTPSYNGLLSLRQQLADGQARLAERQQWQLHDGQTAEQIGELTKKIEELQLQFVPVSNFKDAIDFVGGLIAATGSQLESLDVGSENISLSVLSPTYERARMILERLELSPNFVVSQSEISQVESESGTMFTLNLQAAVTWGTRSPDAGETYARNSPFRR